MEIEVQHSNVKVIAQPGCFPTKADLGDAGYDLYASKDVFIQRDTGELIPLGIQTAFDPGIVALLWDRSGLSTKNDLHRFAGVIDSTYRGEWKVYLFNHGEKHCHIKKGDKVIQVLFQRYLNPEIVMVESLPVSRRNEKGFGSSGV